MKARTSFRCTIQEPGQQTMSLCTGIQVNVPAGLTRQQAVDYVTGKIAKEIGTYAAWEALGMGREGIGSMEEAGSHEARATAPRPAVCWVQVDHMHKAWLEVDKFKAKEGK